MANATVPLDGRRDPPGSPGQECGGGGGTGASGRNASGTMGTIATLLAPSREQVPLRQKRKAAFDRAPKKPVSKPKFSAASIATRHDAERERAEREQQARDKAAAVAPRVEHDTAFVAWLNAQQFHDVESNEARVYLVSDLPYKGEHEFRDEGIKKMVRDTGARWRSNPDFTEGVRDGQRPGWYVANDIDVLFALVTLPLSTTATGRYGDGMITKRTWRPLSVVDTSHDAIGKLINEFRRYQRVEAARILAESERDARERAIASGIVVPDDPDVPSMDYMTAFTRAARQMPFRMPVIYFGTTHPWMVPPPSASQWDELSRQLDAQMRVGGTAKADGDDERRIPLPLRTYCTSCESVVVDQFLDCGCQCAKNATPREWLVCPDCMCLCCDAQPCACKVGMEKWDAVQYAMAARAQAREEAATNGGGAGENDDEDDFEDEGPYAVSVPAKPTKETPTDESALSANSGLTRWLG